MIPSRSSEIMILSQSSEAKTKKKTKSKTPSKRKASQPAARGFNGLETENDVEIIELSSDDDGEESDGKPSALAVKDRNAGDDLWDDEESEFEFED